MAALKIIISFCAISFHALILSSSETRLRQMTSPEKGCPWVSQESFMFLPNDTSLLGLYCALGNGETYEKARDISASHVWVGMLLILKNKQCRVCCARGNDSGSIYYSVLQKGPSIFCKKNIKRRAKPAIP
uniref:Secreted protein n=1 Tax=Amblyomma americanum TaxID=6943 RepID=A0A0C9R566_AMBAM